MSACNGQHYTYHGSCKSTAPCCWNIVHKPIAQPKQGTSYNAYIASELKAGGGSTISKDPTKNMRLAAAKWQAGKQPRKA